MTAPAAPLQLSYRLEPLRPFLEDDSLTEICVNRPNEVWTEGRAGWVKHNIDFSFEHAMQLATLIASFNKDTITVDKPVMSAKLPSGQRLQIVIPGACSAGTVSYTIRRPSKSKYNLQDYQNQGAFSNVSKSMRILKPFEKELLDLLDRGNYLEFLEMAVTTHRNIIIAGATGSGKTTFTESLINCISPNERLITIEDTAELLLTDFPNKIHLFYKDHKGSKFTSEEAIKSCVRMKPDRILLAELRGAETLSYIDSLNTGHPGSITTIHANSAIEVFARLNTLIKKNEIAANLDAEYINTMCVKAIDVILFFEDYKLREVYYEPERKLATMG